MTADDISIDLDREHITIHVRASGGARFCFGGSVGVWGEGDGAAPLRARDPAAAPITARAHISDLR